MKIFYLNSTSLHIHAAFNLFYLYMDIIINDICHVNLMYANEPRKMESRSLPIGLLPRLVNTINVH